MIKESEWNNDLKHTIKIFQNLHINLHFWPSNIKMQSKNCEWKIKIKIIFTKNENEMSKIYSYYIYS